MNGIGFLPKNSFIFGEKDNFDTITLYCGSRQLYLRGRVIEWKYCFYDPIEEENPQCQR